jgi:hypothetical protein
MYVPYTPGTPVRIEMPFRDARLNPYVEKFSATVEEYDELFCNYMVRKPGGELTWVAEDWIVGVVRIC